VPTTIADGGVLMRDRRLPALDVGAVATELAQRLPEPAGCAQGPVSGTTTSGAERADAAEQFCPVPPWG
jgi:hypothetical protein